MAQVIVHARRASLDVHQGALSNAIHGAIVAALDYPPEKRFQRFVGLDERDFIYPDDRGVHYTIVEISMFEGRSDSAKRALVQELFARIDSEVGIPPHSVEITINETPKVNWGIRGRNAEDLALGYKIDV